MLAIFLYTLASLLLSVMIINANEPVMDLAQLVQPTATYSSIPPIPVPAALSASSAMIPPDDSPSSADGASFSSQEDFGSILSDYNNVVKNMLYNSNNNNTSNKKKRLSVFSWPWRRVRATASSRQRVFGKHSRKTRPRHSRYSPPAQAAYSREEYDEYSQRQTTIAFNKSGFCDKVASPHSDSQELLTSPLPVALPNKS
ncbi:unnamed protein product [Mortierella alpina]